MHTTDVAIIGGGQAGLSLSRHLGELAIDHLVFERGSVGERWRNATWDSLRLLTPNWMNGLPFAPYSGDDPHGFMSRDEFIGSLGRYASGCASHVCWATDVLCVEQIGRERFVLTTTAGTVVARTVVIASGHCQIPYFPFGRDVAGPDVMSLHASEYRSPQQLAPAPVLVVGASSSGLQIAEELARSGLPVTLAVGSHTRLPRLWRGRDVFWWMRETGMLSQSTRDFHSPTGAARQPSLQLVGRPDRASVDLGTLQAAGVRLAGRLAAIDAEQYHFADDLKASMFAAETKQTRLLANFDTLAVQMRHLPPDRVQPITVAGDAPHSLALHAFGTVIWATGYRREFPWLKIPAFTLGGEIEHVEGVTRVPGLYALGFRFLRKRDSNFIHGVGSDAAFIAGRIAAQLGQTFKRAI